MSGPGGESKGDLDSVESSPIVEAGKSVVASRGMVTELWDAWSNKSSASLQKRSCCSAVDEGLERGCEDIGRRCCTAVCSKRRVV